MATGAAGRLGGQLGDAAEAVAAEHGVDHLQMDGAQPLDEPERLRAAPSPAGRRGAARLAAPSSRRPEHVRLDGRRRVGVGLEGLLAGLAGPDAVGLLDRQDEHLAVADRRRCGACLRIVSTIVCTSPSATTHSILIFGRR